MSKQRGTRPVGSIGRPKGSRKPSPDRRDAMRIFTAWRAAGADMIVSIETAYELTFGLVDLDDHLNRGNISLAALALKYAIAQRKAK